MTKLHKHVGAVVVWVEHTDEELDRRLNILRRSASPLFSISLSGDRNNIICKSVRTGNVRFVESVDILWN